MNIFSEGFNECMYKVQGMKESGRNKVMRLEKYAEFLSSFSGEI